MGYRSMPTRDGDWAPHPNLMRRATSLEGNADRTPEQLRRPERTYSHAGGRPVQVAAPATRTAPGAHTIAPAVKGTFEECSVGESVAPPPRTSVHPSFRSIGDLPCTTRPVHRLPALASMRGRRFTPSSLGPRSRGRHITKLPFGDAIPIWSVRFRRRLSILFRRHFQAMGSFIAIRCRCRAGFVCPE